MSKEVIKCCNNLISLCLGAKKKNFIDEIVQINTFNWFEKLLEGSSAYMLHAKKSSNVKEILTPSPLILLRVVT